MTAHTFTRLHVPSGRESQGEFNASHHWVFCDPEGVRPRTVEAAKLGLISRWNAQQPMEWKYWI